jgi:hypothetical protein
MWIFTRDGFFSIVRHRDDPGSFLVRARVREDLERAFGGAGCDQCDGGKTDFAALLGKPCPSCGIQELADADYRFRGSVSELRVRNYLTNAVTDIDYETNVKGNLDQGEPDRHRAMMNVWDAMYDVQINRAVQERDRSTGKR